MSFSLFNKNIEEAVKPAIAIEFFHNFTLIHDDIMDSAEIRRGEKTIHNKWNNNTGILSGDLLMIFAYKMLESISDNNMSLILKKFNSISIKVCEGQQFDMDYESQDSVREADYLEMIKLKTAVLLGFSLELGGIIGGCDNNISNQLYKIGENMGVGFQLKDDYLDVFGNKNFGKKIGGDILNNKNTYLIIKLKEKANKVDLEKINFWLKDKNEPNKKISEITKMMIKYKIDKIAEDKIKSYFEDGIKTLKSLKEDGLNTEALINYFDYMMNRKK
tara:strand:+ start:48 stop:872 length:825 start_codon:yes stop_codon:yes gene_type:complete